MAERLHRPQDDHRAARSPDPPLRYHRNRKRQLALQEPWRRSSHNPRSRRLRNPDQLRRRERYRPDSSLKRVKIGRRPRVKFGRRLTADRVTSRACCRDQSIPSTSAANCPDVSRITPSVTGGHRNAPCSSCLQNSTRPEPYQTEIFTRSVRFERNTKIVPENGSSPSVLLTRATSPSAPLRKSIGRVATSTRIPAGTAIMSLPSRRAAHRGASQGRRRVRAGPPRPLPRSQSIQPASQPNWPRPARPPR